MSGYPKRLPVFISWSSLCSCSFTWCQYFSVPNTLWGDESQAQFTIKILLCEVNLLVRSLRPACAVTYHDQAQAGLRDSCVKDGTDAHRVNLVAAWHVNVIQVRVSVDRSVPGRPSIRAGLTGRSPHAACAKRWSYPVTDAPHLGKRPPAMGSPSVFRAR